MLYFIIRGKQSDESSHIKVFVIKNAEITKVIYVGMAEVGYQKYQNPVMSKVKVMSRLITHNVCGLIISKFFHVFRRR